MNTEQKIKNIRELKDFTQEYMAEQLGITQAAYSKIETGQTKLTPNKISDIAEIFEMDASDLMAYDMQKYFNSFNNVKGSNNGSTITHDETIKKFYDEVVALHKDKITLLEKLLNSTEKDLIKYRKNTVSCKISKLGYVTSSDFSEYPVMSIIEKFSIHYTSFRYSN